MAYVLYLHITVSLISKVVLMSVILILNMILKYSAMYPDKGEFTMLTIRMLRYAHL